VPFAAWGSAFFNRVKAVEPLVAQAAARRPDQDIRVGAWQLEHLPSLNFYVRRDVNVLRSEKDLQILLQYPLPVYVFLPAPTWESCRAATRRAGREIARHRDFYRRRDVVVVTNHFDKFTTSPQVAGGSLAP
jgi:hypothetical protein